MLFHPPVPLWRSLSLASITPMSLRMYDCDFLIMCVISRNGGSGFQLFNNDLFANSILEEMPVCKMNKTSNGESHDNSPEWHRCRKTAMERGEERRGEERPPPFTVRGTLEPMQRCIFYLSQLPHCIYNHCGSVIMHHATCMYH